MLTVLPERSLLDFKRQAASQACFALLAHPVEIFRMVRSGAKVRGDYVLHGEAGMVEHELVRVQSGAVRRQHIDGVGMASVMRRSSLSSCRSFSSASFAAVTSNTAPINSTSRPVSFFMARAVTLRCLAAPSGIKSRCSK